MPWDRGAPHPLLVEWAQARRLDGGGRRALVVGAGLGADAAYLAGLGFDTVAFDISATAIRTARGRFPDSAVEFVVANLLDPSADWRDAFALVVEILTVQSLPDPPRREAIARVADMVGPGGTLVVIATARDEEDGPVDGPPWPLTRAEIDAFGTGSLQPVHVEDIGDAAQPTIRRWRAEFRRPS